MGAKFTAGYMTTLANDAAHETSNPNHQKIDPFATEISVFCLTDLNLKLCPGRNERVGVAGRKQWIPVAMLVSI